MNTRHLAVWLPCMLILAMLASLVTPSPVLAAGEPPPPPGEKSPKAPAAPGKPAPPAAAASSSYTAEIPVTAPDGAANAAAIALSVDAIAQAGAVLVGPSGNPLPLAAQETAGVLAMGDVYFKGSGSGCGGGRCNYDTIANALIAFSAHNGTGMIYVTGASAETGAVDVNGTLGLGKLTGLAWDGSTVKAARILNGLLTIQNMLKGFTVDGFYIGKGIYAHDNAGTLRLQNLYVTNAGGAGIFVNNHKGNIDLFNVTVTGAMGAVDHQTGGDGTYLDNCIWNDTTHKCTGTGNVTIGNSSFNVNRDRGLYVYTSGSALLERVEAIGNWVSRSGEGVYLKVGKGAMVKDSRFNGNGWSDQAGLKIEGAGAINLQNVEARDNEGDGIIINVANDITFNNVFFANKHGYGLEAYSSGGNITLNNLKSTSNPLGVKVDNSTSASPKTVTITNSFFNGSSAGDGLLVRSKGSVTLNHIHAESNSGMGVNIDNRLYNGITNTYQGSGSVSLLNTNGLNQISGNSGAALNVKSKGAITVKGVYAPGNHAGLVLDGCAVDSDPLHTTHYCLDKSNVTLSAVRVEGTSTGGGLVVLSGGAISLDGSSFISNQNQVSLVNYMVAAGKPVTVTNSSFEKTVNATSVGLEVYSKGSITLNNVQAASNQGKLVYGPMLEPVSGILLDNCMMAGSACTGSGKVSVLSSLGASKAYGNAAGEGLFILAQGAITVSGFSSTNNGGGAVLDNSHGALTITNSTFSYNTGTRGGLIARSTGAITLSGVEASENSAGPGASVKNIFGPTTMDVISISKSIFNHNWASGVGVNAKGNLTLNNVSANTNEEHNGDFGANLRSNNGNVTVLDTLGVNQFCDNMGFGLYAAAGKGSISISGVTASNNNWDGIDLDNTGAAATKTVTAQKILADGNGMSGVVINSKGSVTLNGVQANYNTSYYGVHINNCQFGTACAGSGSVSLLSTLGLNGMDHNLFGLWIKSGGNVLVNGTTTTNGRNDFYDSSGLSGAWIENYFTPGKTVTVNQGNFNYNQGFGLYIRSAGVITLNSIGASYNSFESGELNNGDGLFIRNDEVGVTAGINILSTSGINQFNGNSHWGLWVSSNGNIALNKVIASDNGLSGPYSGAVLHARGAKSSVSITCSAFNHNGQWGLEVVMGAGVLTFKSVAANHNLGAAPIEVDLGGMTPMVSWTVCGK